MKILDLIESALKENGYLSYSRVDEAVLWVGNSDDELNRTLDLSFKNSIRVQIGSATNYFEEDNLDIKRVLELFLKTLSYDILETVSKSKTKTLERRYEIQELNEKIDLGMESSFTGIWSKKNHEEQIIHKPILKKETTSALMKRLIDQITEFGINPKVELTEKIDVLKKLLVGIYAEFLNVEFEFDETDYEEEPDFDYDKILENVKSNFPNFGWYSSVLDSNKMEPNIEIGIGDELDDLSDIIRDLLAVKWKMENTSMDDALWQFQFSMQSHSEQHLVDLLKRLKERND